ncbi:MAG: hypothetical protein KGK14_02130 [Bacteroidota bacterium]|nr:hypothetical protein [Bacteroidota bacterium]
MQLLKTAIVVVLIGLSICCKKKDTNSGLVANITSSIQLKAYLPNQLSSSSGLCFTNNKLYTFNDSGNPPELYAIDTSTGKIVQTILITNYPNVDWEDITADDNYIYIGDFGNNNGNRKDLKILRVKKSDINKPEAFLSVQAEAIQYVYADQNTFTINTNTNYDCEAMISVDTCLYLFTKNRGDDKTRLYCLPKQPGNYFISPITTYNCQGKITGADFNDSTKEIALIGYENKKLNSFILLLNNFKDNNFFNGSVQRIKIGNDTTDWQTEGICFITSQHLFISCETSQTSLAGLFSMQNK